MAHAAWMLVAHHEEGVRDFARDTLKAKFNELNPNRPVRIARVPNLEHAQDEVDESGARSCQLIVLGAATPANRNVSVGSSTREPTLEFIKKLKIPNRQLPIIVVSSDPDAELRGFLRAYERTAWIDFKPETDWCNDLAREAERLMKGTAGRQSGVLEVEIILGSGNEQSWRLERDAPNPVEAFGALTVDAIELERIKEKSLRLSGEITGSQWAATLSELSSDLGKLLFQATNQNQEFWEKFVELRAESGGQGQTSIRFTVNDSTHPVFVEALKYGSARKYWMLVSPIFRRYYRQNVCRPPLFQDDASERGPINCLVIAAESKPGIIGDKAFSLLRHLGTEAAKVVEILGRNKAHGIGDVELFDLATVDGDRDQVVTALYGKLREKPWHLVHFAGHVGLLPRALLGGKQSLSEQEKEDKASSLILSPSRKIVLDVANFLNKLELTQFLFVSSCRSADGYVIASAARESIPAVLGFRWTVDDRKAAQFAERFYGQLFSHGRCFKSLEYAFRDARSLTYEADVNDPTWASPVLMMQLKQTQPA